MWLIFATILFKEFNMMRKLLTATLFMVVVSALIPGEAMASATQKPGEALVVKTEPAARQKALIDKKTAKLAADKAKLQAAKVTVASVAPRRVCGSFLRCLFGASHRNQANTAGLAGLGLGGNSLRTTVAWNEAKYKPGTLIVKTPERALYYVLDGGEAVRYPIGVGREGFQWGGHSRIVAKTEWPTWHPPAEMIKREAAKGHILPEMMEGGPENPLGARAMYIGGTIYRVHGTNNEASIGGAVSSGCIRMMNADVIDLYNRVKVGSPIYVYQ
jgi:lipoprotein-anchoring transpeptidase ErfK/SrfK